MKTKTLWKDISRSITKSKGRFLSLFLLMALGSFALVGLKVTGPDMEKTGHSYLEQHVVMDMAIIASEPFSQSVQQDLKRVTGDAVADYAKMTDARMVSNHKAIRLFSLPKQLSKAELVKGRFPKQEKEILLSHQMIRHYQIGETLTITTKEEGLLKAKDFKIVGFANSPEIWSKTNLGNATSGDSSLYTYAYLSEDAFQLKGCNLLRLRYPVLRAYNAFSVAYSSKLKQLQSPLEKFLSQEATKQYQERQKQLTKTIDDGQKQLDQAKANLASYGRQVNPLTQVTPELSKERLDQAQKEIASKERLLKETKVE
ncbi:hypothetical protein ACVRY7_09955 [Streptococcus ictaluri]|uniref:Efflux ABC transporter, permease protein n=1 Tax=Streptococcus ictaluri 707-05 TaxID=764299 RepID=G5K2T8_9STRE|nr:hypothetical protein [Streptococcus ictaluri]EHI69584.1 hypothetical protein STRIC_1106 [Streptococcus ictaluri 707-05]